MRTDDSPAGQPARARSLAAAGRLAAAAIAIVTPLLAPAVADAGPPSPTAQVVIRASDAAGYEAGGLAGELVSQPYRPCLAANALLASAPAPTVASAPREGKDATTGASFTQGSLAVSGVERVISSIAWYASSEPQARAAYSALIGGSFISCLEGVLDKQAGLAETATVSSSPLPVPSVPGADSATLVRLSLYDTAAGTTGKVLLYGLTAIRVGRMLALLETDIVTNALPAAVPFPEGERAHLVQLLAKRMAGASLRAQAPVIADCLCEKANVPNRGGQVIRFAIMGKSVCPSDWVYDDRSYTHTITKIIVEGRNQERHWAKWTMTETQPSSAAEVLVGNGHWWWIGNVTIRYWLGSTQYTTRAWVPQWRSSAFDLEKGLVVDATCGGTLKLGQSIGPRVPPNLTSRVSCFTADGTVAGLETRAEYTGLFLVGWNGQLVDDEALGENGEAFIMPNIVIQDGQEIDCEVPGSTNTDTSE